MTIAIDLDDQLLNWADDIESIYLSVYLHKTSSEAKLLTGLMKSPSVFGLVLSRQAKAIGFILLMGTGEQADILEICVMPPFQAQGYGRLLLEAGINLSNSFHHKTVFLEVAEDNLAARHLYQSAGFTKIAQRSGYYQRGHQKIDALVMQKQLSC